MAAEGDDEIYVSNFEESEADRYELTPEPLNDHGYSAQPLMSLSRKRKHSAQSLNDPDEVLDKCFRIKHQSTRQRLRNTSHSRKIISPSLSKGEHVFIRKCPFIKEDCWNSDVITIETTSGYRSHVYKDIIDWASPIDLECLICQKEGLDCASFSTDVAIIDHIKEEHLVPLVIPLLPNKRPYKCPLYRLCMHSSDTREETAQHYLNHKISGGKTPFQSLLVSQLIIGPKTSWPAVSKRHDNLAILEGRIDQLEGHSRSSGALQAQLISARQEVEKIQKEKVESLEKMATELGMVKQELSSLQETANKASLENLKLIEKLKESGRLLFIEKTLSNSQALKEKSLECDQLKIKNQTLTADLQTAQNTVKEQFEKLEASSLQHKKLAVANGKIQEAISQKDEKYKTCSNAKYDALKKVKSLTQANKKLESDNEELKKRVETSKRFEYDLKMLQKKYEELKERCNVSAKEDLKMKAFQLQQDNVTLVQTNQKLKLLNANLESRHDKMVHELNNKLKNLRAKNAHQAKIIQDRNNEISEFLSVDDDDAPTNEETPPSPDLTFKVEGDNMEEISNVQNVIE